MDLTGFFIVIGTTLTLLIIAMPDVVIEAYDKMHDALQRFVHHRLTKR